MMAIRLCIYVTCQYWSATCQLNLLQLALVMIVVRSSNIPQKDLYAVYTIESRSQFFDPKASTMNRTARETLCTVPLGPVTVCLVCLLLSSTSNSLAYRTNKK